MYYKLALLLGLLCSSLLLNAQEIVLTDNTTTTITEGSLLVDTSGKRLRFLNLLQLFPSKIQWLNITLINALLY